MAAPLRQPHAVSPARRSSLPGLPFPGDPSRYPHRDEVIAYLRRYAQINEVPLELCQPVTRVRADDDHDFVETATGRTWRARVVIAATGTLSTPNRPPLPGLADFAGSVHSSEYRDPSPFRGQRVVVGAGNSDVQATPMCRSPTNSPDTPR